MATIKAHDLWQDVYIIPGNDSASTRLLKCLISDAAYNKTQVYQLEFIQAFIQSDAKKRMFILLDKEYETFYPKLSEYFGRPLKLKKVSIWSRFQWQELV